MSSIYSFGITLPFASIAKFFLQSKIIFFHIVFTQRQIQFQRLRLQQIIFSKLNLIAENASIINHTMYLFNNARPVIKSHT